MSTPVFAALLAVAIVALGVGLLVWNDRFRRVPLAQFGLENVQRVGAWDSSAWRERVWSRGWMASAEWRAVNKRQLAAIDAELKRRGMSRPTRKTVIRTMNKLIPPRADRYPLSCFIALLLLLSIVACAMPLWAHALYLAWVIVGVAALVKERVEPGLPSTLRGNVRRILRAHVWPLYMA